jgi:hypothetical protein
MIEVCDSGKIWCKGSSSPIHAVRVGDKIFATGKEENQTIECWVEGNILCVDLHGGKTRIARKLSLDIEPTLAGTLFNGFTKTKHADVSIVGPNQTGVEEKIVSGESYKAGQCENMSAVNFWNFIWPE